MTIYIVRRDKSSGEFEIVDETDTQEDADYLCGEYTLADRFADYVATAEPASHLLAEWT